MIQQTPYRWTEGYKPGAKAWPVIVCAVVGLYLGIPRDFSDPSAVTQIVYILLGVTFAAGLLLTQTRFEAAIKDGNLVFRSRPLFGALSNWPWTERRIARRSISSFRFEQNAWTELKILTIVLDDGSSVGIPGPKASARPDSFDSFVASFRAFFGTEPGRDAPKSVTVWRMPMHRVLVAGATVAAAVAMVMAIWPVRDQESTMILAIVAFMVVVQGVGFVLKRE